MLSMTEKWDKTFPKSDKVEHRKVSFLNRFGIELAADLYAPRAAAAPLPAVAVCGPFGAVKEQASGLYAQTLAERGFLTIAFDPSFTGESGGAARNVASPDVNTEDFQAAVDFLVTHPAVDPARVAILGICGWGGLALNAAALDTRVKATVACTMYDMSRVTARGYFDQADSEAARHAMREALCAQRTKDFASGVSARAGGVADTLPDDAPWVVREGLPRLLQDPARLSSPLPQFQRRLERHLHPFHPQPAHPCLRRGNPRRRPHRPWREGPLLLLRQGHLQTPQRR